jgi:hypothetical protein
MFECLKFIDTVLVIPALLGIIIFDIVKLFTPERKFKIEGLKVLFFFTCVHTILIIMILIKI